MFDDFVPPFMSSTHSIITSSPNRRREDSCIHHSCQDALPKKIIVYTETRQRCTLYTERLGQELDSEASLYHHDILTIQGTLAKETKTKIIELFMNEDGPSILCATSGVGNAGIDSKQVRLVVRLDFPRSIVDICQEKGRAGRLPQNYN